MSWKNEQIKEDKIEKLIESFQIKGKQITISPKGGSEKKENLFNAKKILSCFYEETQAIQRTKLE